MADHSAALKRILSHIEKHSYYILPHKFYTSEEGAIRIKVILWKTDHENHYFDFGITVQTRGIIEHQLFNIKQPVLSLNEAYIQQQLDRVARILARPLRPLCGTLGPHKSAMLAAIGMDKKALGIDNCCVCGKETAMQTHTCSHNVCLYCLKKVSKCPMCRNEELACACCVENVFESDNDNETDDEFLDV